MKYSFFKKTLLYINANKDNNIHMSEAMVLATHTKEWQ